jgi:hypothetical protein
MDMGRVRAWTATVSAALGLILCGVTVVVPDWLERVFEVRPDAGGGEAEWLTAAGLLAIAVVCSGWASLEWRSVRVAAKRTSRSN